jgi:serine/threonine protein kinase
MTPERWAKVRDVLGQVLELESEKRSQFLDDACANDTSLRGEVESLLSSDESARSSFLQSPPTPPAALIKGTKLGDYEIVSLVGSGGMGEVYRARDTKLKREVAIKVLPAYWSRDPDRLQRFELEARAAAALNHPNITSIFHVGQHDGSPYIVTELLQGETLRERLRTGPLRLREALDFGVEIARGLGAAHDAGVIHRDLKPENTFVTKDGRIKILDFGLAKLQVPKSAKPEDPTVIPRQTNPGQVLGTVGYMSPEQVRGHSTDARSDIFAAGAVLYEMLTGKPAFRKATSAETISAILNEDPTPVSQLAPSLPPALQRIINRCLAKSPDQRFQHASDVAFALEALSDSSSATSHDVQETKSSKKWIWTALSTAALAIAAAVIWWNRPPAVPVVEAVTQLTDDGKPKKTTSLATDGSRIYFNEGSDENWKIAQVSVAGGETSVLPTSLDNPEVAGIAPDGSALLALVGLTDPAALWTIPLPTGEPRRLGTIKTTDWVDYLPEGHLVFAQGTGLYVAERDGSNIRTLLTAPGAAGCPVVSPDGKWIVFAVYIPGKATPSFAEASADGSGFHEILAGTKDSSVHCPMWTPDSKHLVYRISQSGRSDIWTAAVRSRFSRRYGQATQLTNGPVFYSGVVPSRDGKHIFTIGTRRRGELVRYDLNTKQFVPFLGGISAIHPTFSRDAQWVAYTSYSDHTLWRSRADGTDRLQLTYPPVEVSNPVISPDGRQVSFQSYWGEAYVIAMDGGTPRKVAGKASYHSTVSPNGNAIVYSSWTAEKHEGLRIFDLRNGAVTLLPSSEDKVSPFWVDQNTLVAATLDQNKLVTFGLESGKWSDLLAGGVVDFMPSPDGKYIYYTTRGAEQIAMRIRLADHKVELLTSLKDLRRVVDTDPELTQLSVAPDGSPVFTRDIGTQEIYALTVKWP